MAGEVNKDRLRYKSEVTGNLMCMKTIYGLMKTRLWITSLTFCTDGKFIVETNFNIENHEAEWPDAAIILPILTIAFYFTRT